MTTEMIYIVHVSCVLSLPVHHKLRDRPYMLLGPQVPKFVTGHFETSATDIGLMFEII